eukprot:scaffold6284_cov126-Isochrysis_galbana.AAC.3
MYRRTDRHPFAAEPWVNGYVSQAPPAARADMVSAEGALSISAAPPDATMFFSRPAVSRATVAAFIAASLAKRGARSDLSTSDPPPAASSVFTAWLSSAGMRTKPKVSAPGDTAAGAGLGLPRSSARSTSTPRARSSGPAAAVTDAGLAAATAAVGPTGGDGAASGLRMPAWASSAIFSSELRLSKSRPSSKASRLMLMRSCVSTPQKRREHTLRAPMCLVSCRPSARRQRLSIAQLTGQASLGLDTRAPPALAPLPAASCRACVPDRLDAVTRERKTTTTMSHRQSGPHSGSSPPAPSHSTDSEHIEPGSDAASDGVSSPPEHRGRSEPDERRRHLLEDREFLGDLLDNLLELQHERRAAQPRAGADDRTAVGRGRSTPVAAGRPEQQPDQPDSVNETILSPESYYYSEIIKVETGAASKGTLIEDLEPPTSAYVGECVSTLVG